MAKKLGINIIEKSIVQANEIPQKTLFPLEMAVDRYVELLLFKKIKKLDAAEHKKVIDRQYIRTPFYGSRRMAIWLQGQGYAVNRKRVVRLMRKMGLEGQAPGPSTSKPHPEHKVYPYLLRGLEITSVNQVWSTDITYIPLRQGYMYLVAVMDWYSRYPVVRR